MFNVEVWRVGGIANKVWRCSAALDFDEPAQ